MPTRDTADRTLLGVTLLLVLLGLVMVFSASAVSAGVRLKSPHYFLVRQVIWSVIGLAVMFALMQVDYRRYRSPRVLFPLMGVTALLLVAVFFLDRSHNTHRWIRLGPISMQPSELAKPTLILFLAWYMERRGKAIQGWRQLAPEAITVVP